MTAGLATLSLLNGRAYAKLEKTSSMMEKGLLEASEEPSLAVTINRVGSMVGIFFGNAPIRNFAEVKRSNHKLYPRFLRRMLESGIYLPPSPFETIFLSTLTPRRCRRPSRRPGRPSRSAPGERCLNTTFLEACREGT